MNKVDWILLICEQETRLSHLAKQMGWEMGAMSSTLATLCERKLLENPRRGIYVATQAGLDKATAKLAKEKNTSKGIDRIVNRVSAQLTTKSLETAIGGFRYEKDSLMPPAKTETLRYVIKDIYIKTVSLTHKDDHDLIMSMWRNHRKPSCSDCTFDFERSYENHVTYIKNYASKKVLFKKLRWESFPDIEKYKKMFKLDTAWTPSDFPESWND